MASIQQGRVNNGFQTLVKLFRFQSASSESSNSWTRHPRQPLHDGFCPIPVPGDNFHVRNASTDDGPRTARGVLVIPFVWSLIGGSAAILLPHATRLASPRQRLHRWTADGFSRPTDDTKYPDQLRTRCSTSAPGRSLPKWVVRATSAYPPIATTERTSRHVSKVPTRDSSTAAISISIRSPRRR